MIHKKCAGEKEPPSLRRRSGVMVGASCRKKYIKKNLGDNPRKYDYKQKD